jgi:hypothetical protein
MLLETASTELTVKARVPRQAKPLGKLARCVLPSFGSLTLLLVFYLLFTNNHRFLLDSDTGWHIRTGDLIRQLVAAPHHDVFSFTMQGRDWFAWEWLADVALSGLHRWRGLVGVAAGAWLMLLVSYTALYRVMLWRGADPVIACAATVFGAVASIVHWLARPHLVSILLMVAWVMLFESFRRKRSRWIYSIPLLIALWANLHGAFVVTFAMVAVYALGETLELAVKGEWRSSQTKLVWYTYALVGVLSAVAALGTPYGFKLYGHLWRYLGDTTLLATIDEFKSPDFHSVDGKLIEILLLLGVIAAVNAARQRRFVETGLVLLWGHLTLQSERHVTLAVIVLMPIIAEQLSRLTSEAAAKLTERKAGALIAIRGWYRNIRALDRQLNDALVYALVLIGLFALTGSAAAERIFSARFSPKRFPVEAADFIARNLQTGLLKGNPYAIDQYGGYLIYRFTPQVQVFVDGRSDLYRQSAVLDDMNRIAQVQPAWSELLAKYEIGWMVLQRNEPLAAVALQSGRWTSVHEDATAQVLVSQNLAKQVEVVGAPNQPQNSVQR